MERHAVSICTKYQTKAQAPLRATPPAFTPHFNPRATRPLHGAPAAFQPACAFKEATYFARHTSG